jgi:hypothetical protein
MDKPGWAVIIEKHVVPLDDAREHITDVACWCHPSQDSGDEHLYVHHSADGREAREHLSVVA